MSLDIGFQQVDIIHTMVGAIAVDGVDRDLLRTGKRDTEMVQLPLA